MQVILPEDAPVVAAAFCDQKLTFRGHLLAAPGPARLCSVRCIRQDLDRKLGTAGDRDFAGGGRDEERVVQVWSRTRVERLIPVSQAEQPVWAALVHSAVLVRHATIFGHSRDGLAGRVPYEYE